MSHPALGTFALLLLLGAGSLAAEGTLEIHIRSTYFGHEGFEEEVTISCEGQRCRADGKAVEWAAVERLLEAVERPALTAPTAEGLGISRTWLTENAAEAWTELPLHGEVPTEGQKALFASAFADPQRLQPGLIQHFSVPLSLHDLPGVFVEIRRADGSTVEVQATSSSLYLMPWEVTKGGSKTTTYDRVLSDAVAQLMPDGFLNRSRLLDPDVREELALGLWYSMLEEWLRVGAEDRLGRSLDVVRQRYTISESSVVSLPQGETKVTTWDATLTGGGLPPSVAVRVSLAVEGDHLVAPEQALERIERAAVLPLSLPWFRATLAEHPDAEVVIHFEKDRSFSPQWLELFTDTMAAGSEEQEALAEELTRSAAEAVRLDVFQGEGQLSRWVAFPDRRMVLWDYRGEQMLDWTLPKCAELCRAGRVVGGDGGMAISLPD